MGYHHHLLQMICGASRCRHTYGHAAQADVDVLCSAGMMTTLKGPATTTPTFQNGMQHGQTPSMASLQAAGELGCSMHCGLVAVHQLALRVLDCAVASALLWHGDVYYCSQLVPFSPSCSKQLRSPFAANTGRTQACTGWKLT